MPRRRGRQICRSQTIPSPAHEAAAGLLRTAEVVRRRLATVLAPYGVTLAQYNVLRILRGAGAEGLPTLEVAARLIERSPGVTRMMDRLEARGWVRRRRPADDRREVVCMLTQQGLDLVRRIERPMDAAVASLTLPLSRPERRELVRLLDIVSEQEP